MNQLPLLSGRPLFWVKTSSGSVCVERPFCRFIEGSTAVVEPLPQKVCFENHLKNPNSGGKSESITVPQEVTEKPIYLFLDLFDFTIICCVDVVRTKDPHHKRVMSKNSD